MGWAVDRAVRFRIGDDEIPFRFSVVYRREDGVWKMVHFHSSIGVPNEEAVGVEACRTNRAIRGGSSGNQPCLALPSGTVTFLFTDIEGSTAVGTGSRGDGIRRRRHLALLRAASRPMAACCSRPWGRGPGRLPDHF